MSAFSVNGENAILPKENPETLELRGRPRRAVRFRRGLIVGIAAAAAVSLAALSWVALAPPAIHRPAAVPDDGDESSVRASPDALAALPKSYGDTPRLGPPLPGDLGRPILEHERNLDDPLAAHGHDSATAADAARAFPVRDDRSIEAVRAAHTSGLMVPLAAAAPAVTAAGALPPSDPALPVAAPEGVASLATSQEHKMRFARAADGSVNPHELSGAASPWILSAGSIIPASLITGLNSDLPGMVIAQVTENVRDSATGREILVPQGARLIGNYDSAITFGQRRALVVWTRIVFPNGSSVELDKMPATDSSGYAGVADGVDSHGLQLLKGIGLSTLLGVGTQLGFGGSESDLVRAIRESAQQNAAHAGDQLTARNLDIQPTIMVRPGWPIRALVNKDLVLEPWRD